MNACMLSSTNEVNIGQGTIFAPVYFDGTAQVTYDPNGWHSDTENNTRITPGIIGTFRLTGSVRFNECTSGYRVGIQFYQNGNSVMMASFPNSVDGYRAATYTCILETSSVDDYFELGVLQDSDNMFLTINNYHFQVELLS